MKRRDFVKTGILATSGVFYIDSFLGCVDPAIKNKRLEEYYKGFQDSPVDSRVFVRWWWNGNRLDKDEILRELDVMKAAGIGGVEINPIAFPQNSDPAGYEELIIFEDKWLEMLKTALSGAKERGIICDLIVGSGWPFGGEFLKKEDQTQMATIETLNLTGEKEYSFSLKELLDMIEPAIHSKNKTVYKDILMVRLVPAASDEFDEGIDLTNNFHNEVLTVNVPKGQFVLYYVVKLTGYMAVINGAPGAAGPVLNHYSKPAVENYLNIISGLITDKIGNMGNHIRAMFCDSLELEGANWNDDLPAEFKVKPYVKFSNPQKYLNQSSYKLGKNRLFFIANTSLSEHISVKAEFQVENNLYPWIWDPETGKKWIYPANDTNNIIELTLPRATSIMIVFDTDSEGEQYIPPKLITDGIEIVGSWQLQLNHINVDQQHFELKSLTDLIQLEKTKNFAGTVVYEKTITINKKDSHYIDLGNVQGISELSLNGKQLGTRWYGAHVYDIGSAVKTGENKLSVRLTTITGNYLKSLKDNPIAQRWTQNQLYKSMGILGPVKII